MAENIKRYVLRKGAARRIPVNGSFELTPRCNLNCEMCYIHMSAQEQQAAGRELTTDQWLQLGRQAVDAGMVYLLLTGGEPLLRPDFLPLYRALVGMGLMVSVNTNATLITPEVLAAWRQQRPERVNITLYGMSRESYGAVCGVPGGFERVIHGIRALKAAGIRVVLNTTFTRRNLADMEDIVAFAKEENIPVRMAAYVFPPVRNGHETVDTGLTAEEYGQAAARFDRLTMSEEQLDKRRAYIRSCLAEMPDDSLAPEGRISSCMAGRGAFWVSWDGQLYSCGMLPFEGKNVLEVPFAEAWQHTTEVMADVHLPSECSSCIYQKLCPMCAAVGYSVHGDAGRLAVSLCERTTAYLDEILK